MDFSSAFDEEPASTIYGPKYQAEDFNTLEPRQVTGRVKGLWPTVGVCFVNGASGAGKTFWAIDVCARLALGEPVLGKKSKQCGVLYVGAEDPDGIRLRIKARRETCGVLPEGSFEFFGATPDLRSLDDVEDLKASAADVKANMAAKGIELGVLVIDTMSASIPGADENTAKDMSPVLTALQAMAQDLQILILVAAHPGKDRSLGLRGWSGMHANADGVVTLSIVGEGPVRTITVDKVKNGAAGGVHGFTLVTVTLGTDNDGDPITSCVVEPKDVQLSPSKAKVRLPPGAQLAIHALAYLLDHGPSADHPGCPGVGPGKAVLVDDWKARTIQTGLLDSDNTPNNRRQRWHSAKTKLIRAGFVRIEEPYAIPLEPFWRR